MLVSQVLYNCHALLLTRFTSPLRVSDTMKTSTLFTSIFSAAVAAEKFIAGPPGWAQSIGINATEPEHNPRLIARQVRTGAVSLKNRTPHISGSKSVKIRYGPFTVKGGGAYVLHLQISCITLIGHVLIFSTSFLGS
jgi:hypothetical protein